jgi:TolB-like protein/Tfp pilus assembly protein PilF
VTDTPTEREAESTWTRLRRRKVVQWGVVYVAAAWGFLQGLEYLSGTYDWPRQIQQYTTLVLLIGLPVVLVLAWYHGDRGQQRITTPEFAILTLLLLLGGGAFWYYQRVSEAEKDTLPAASAVQPATSPAVTDPRPSVAVLPFENRSREDDDAYFVDGIHDDILTQLSKVSGLRVISRTSVEQFRDTKLPMKAIADQLGVSKILEGGVQRAGDRVRVTVQLIDADNDAHLWAENYDRELTAANIFAIQSEVAAEIAAALKTALTPTEQARARALPTQSLEAWEAYQLAKHQMASRTIQRLAEAEQLFRKAIGLDPTFALAWAGLSDTLSLQVYYGSRPQEAGLRDAEQAVAKSLELDPSLAEAWASSGSNALQALQLERAEQLLRRAIELNSNYAPAYHWLSMTLTELGRRDEALAAVERAVSIDPLSAIINNWLGMARASAGHFDAALAALRRAIAIDPAMAVAYSNMADVLASGLGRFDLAVPWIEEAASLDPSSADAMAWVALTYWELGDDTQANTWLRRALAGGGNTFATSYVAALVVPAHEETTSARKYAERAAELDPAATFLITNHDLRQGNYRAARTRYVQAFPQLFAKELPKLRGREAFAAIDLATVLQRVGEPERATALLDRSEAYIRTIPRLGAWNAGIADVAVYALRGDNAKALSTLRQAEQAGWRGPLWRYYRDHDPALASIRNEPEFKAVFADIERDMAQQRARLAARPKDAPLDLTDASR